MGKSAYAVFTAIEAAKRGKKVMYFSTEMGVKQLISRMVAQMAPVTMNVAQWRGMEKANSTESMNRLMMGVHRVSDLPIWIDDQAVVPVEEIVRRATAQHYEIGCDLIIVDHMHDLPHSHENPVRAYGMIAKTLKNLAKTLNVPVIMLAQLNRAAAGAVVELPKMTNLEGAGGIEQASDSVLLLHHPFYYDNTKSQYEYKLVVAKNRQGARGMVLNIGYIGKYQQFFNDPDEAARFDCAGDF
jgi:replicative DNA helicase